MDEVVGTVVGRWYVTLFGIVFAWCAVRQLGWRRTVVYAVVAVGVGALAENGSVHLGVPYTRYEFNPELRGDELFIGDVPLMVPLSYTFMSYFAFAGGRLLASGPWRTRAPRPWQELLLAWVLAVWALWILDPVSRLGDDFYLGEVFSYEGPGFWFGLPLGSQLGFAATAAVLLGVLFVMDRHEPDRPVEGLARHPHLVALLTYNAQVLHLAVVALVIGGVPADTIGGAAFIIWIPVAAMVAVHWSNVDPSGPRSTSADLRRQAVEDGVEHDLVGAGRGRDRRKLAQQLEGLVHGRAGDQRAVGGRDGAHTEGAGLLAQGREALGVDQPEPR